MRPNNHGIDLPFIPDDLLAALEKKFLDASPSEQDSERTIWINVGKRELVLYLTDQRRRQKEHAIEGVL